MDIAEIENQIRDYAKQRKIFYTKHAIEQMIKREIDPNGVLDALQNGNVIEFYEEDLPFPSCLMVGFTSKNIPIHIVCSAPPDIWVITVYRPDPTQWIDFKTRR
ncbi:DUF4258 domain-containing protein [candidate division WOR-3 bacterium]|nr:DUF4258 domain-containing protein [candidate division WOR-3 bacterium]